ncbi:MAG: hypothetical protein ACOYKE_01635 [Ferruginibacter sp.]
MPDKLNQQKLNGIGLLLMLLFSFPFLSLVNKKILVAGIPLLYLYIMLVWLLGIVGIFLVVDFRPKRKKRTETHE